MKIPLKTTNEGIIAEEMIIDIPLEVKGKNAFIEGEFSGVRKSASIFVS
jgi:uncharacterized ferredoxin-like protein